MMIKKAWLYTDALCTKLKVSRKKATHLQVDMAVDFIWERHKSDKDFCDTLYNLPEFWTWWLGQIWTSKDRYLYDNIKVEGGKYIYTVSGTIIEDVWLFYKRAHLADIQNFYLNTEVMDIALFAHKSNRKEVKV